MPSKNTPRQRANKQSNSLSYHSLEPKHLLANLAVTDGFLVRNAVDLSRFTPVEGQALQVAADITTTDLDSDQTYEVVYAINGIIFDLPAETEGAGESSSQFLRTSQSPAYGPFHTPSGPSTVEIWLDPNNQIVETDETDNYFTFEFTADKPDLPMKFIWPLGGEMYTENNIYFYPDQDPRHGIIDYRGNTGVSNNHSAFAVGPATNTAVDRGVPVFAAADGKVHVSDDGGAGDRFSPGNYPRGNKVRIFHGGEQGWQTIYTHLRRDSLTVVRGDDVVQGQLLGYVSSTSTKQAPHLLFTVIGASTFVDTSVNFDSYFSNAPDYAFDNPVVTESWITNYEDVNNHAEDGISESYSFRPNSTTDPTVGAIFSGVPKDSTITFQWRNNTGNIFSTEDITTQYSRTKSTHYSTAQLPANASLGIWSVDILIDGVLKRTEQFVVDDATIAEMRIETADHGLIVSNDRYSPYSLGTTTDSSTPTTLTFEVFNHGSGVLNISDVQLGNGFVFTDEVSPSLNPGDSDTFTVQLDPSVLGYRLAQVKFLTSDPTDPIYTFSLEGTVTDGATSFPDNGHFSIGTMERLVDEGEQIQFNIRHPELINEARTYNLSYDTNRFSGPTSITIEAFKPTALFFLEAINDYDITGETNELITASLVGTNETAAVELSRTDLGDLRGTEGGDVVTVSIDDDVTIDLNGKVYKFDLSLQELSFDARGGNDTLIFSTSHRHRLTLSGSELVMNNSVFRFEGIDFETIRATDRSFDSTLVTTRSIAVLWGTSENNAFVSELHQDSMTSGIYSNTAISYLDVDYRAGSAMNSTTVHGSDATETFNLRYLGSELTRLSSDEPNKRLDLGIMDSIQLLDPGAGFDRFSFFAIPQDNLVVRFNDIIELETGEVSAEIDSGYESVYIWGSSEVDQIQITDSTGNDIIDLQHNRLEFVGGPERVVVNFEEMNVISGGGVDEVTLRGTENDDTFVSDATGESLAGNHVTGYRVVNVEMGDGLDTTILHGTDNDDLFGFTNLNASLVTAEKNVFVHDVELANVRDTGDGRDEASITATDSDDYVQANLRDDVSVFKYGNHRYEIDAATEIIVVNAGDGSDRLQLVDSTGDDVTTLRPKSLQIINEVERAAFDFEEIEVISGGGLDQAFFLDFTYDEVFISRNDTESVSRSNSFDDFSNSVAGYAQVNAEMSFPSEQSFHLYGTDNDDSLTVSDEVAIWRTTGKEVVLTNFGIGSVREMGGGTDSVQINGTEIDDRFRAAFNSMGGFSISGSGTPVIGVDIETENVIFDGMGGLNTFEFAGSPTDDSAILIANSVQVNSAVTIIATNVSRIDLVSGGGNDTVEMIASELEDDVFRAEGDVATMTGSTYTNTVTGYKLIKALGGSGGDDQASIFDTAADDEFFVSSNLAVLETSQRRIVASNFDSVFAFSRSGGTDQILIVGSENDDTLYATPTSAQVNGIGFNINAIEFERTIVNLKAGSDASNLIGTEAHERFSASPAYGLMQFEETKIVRVVGSENVTMSSTDGEADYVTLYDSGEDDIFFSNANSATMSNANYKLRAIGFGRVAGISSTGLDQAIMNDSENNDSFIAYPTAAWMNGGTFFNHAVGFEQVFANSSAGNDVAIFYGSEGDDRLNGTKGQTRISGDGFFSSARSFRRVNAYMDQAGFDIGLLADSDDDDQVFAVRAEAMIFSDAYNVYTIGLDRVIADETSGGGEDKLAQRLVEFELVEIGNWN